MKEVNLLELCGNMVLTNK